MFQRFRAQLADVVSGDDMESLMAVQAGDLLRFKTQRQPRRVLLRLAALYMKAEHAGPRLINYYHSEAVSLAFLEARLRAEVGDGLRAVFGFDKNAFYFKAKGGDVRINFFSDAQRRGGKADLFLVDDWHNLADGYVLGHIEPLANPAMSAIVAF